MSSWVRLENGLACRIAEALPAPTVVVEVTLWPEARDWSVAGETFHYHVTHGCSGKVGSYPRDFCVTDRKGIVTGASAQVVSSNCPKDLSHFSGVEIGKPAENCVKATGIIKGCGKTRWGECKGRGWLEGNIKVTVESPTGARTVERFTKSDQRQNLFYSEQYNYDVELPADIKIDKWKYTLKVREAYGGTPSSFTLSDDSPDELKLGCTSTASKPGERNGWVRIACTPPVLARFEAASKARLPQPAFSK